MGLGLLYLQVRALESLIPSMAIIYLTLLLLQLPSTVLLKAMTLKIVSGHLLPRGVDSATGQSSYLLSNIYRIRSGVGAGGNNNQTFDLELRDSSNNLVHSKTFIILDGSYTLTPRYLLLLMKEGHRNGPYLIVVRPKSSHMVWI